MLLKQITLLSALFALSFPLLHAQANDPWKKADFLVGEWTGMGAKDNQPGAGEGSFSFRPELDRKIIVRRNSAHYASGQNHEDLMILYLDTPDAPHAIYFDSEGHVIRYSLSFPGPNRVVFESDTSQPGPRYRLTYWMEGALLDGKFEVAPPSSEYKTYLNWTSRKR